MACGKRPSRLRSVRHHRSMAGGTLRLDLVCDILATLPTSSSARVARQVRQDSAFVRVRSRVRSGWGFRSTKRSRRTGANWSERLHQIDKLGVTGSSPVPPIIKALLKGFSCCSAGRPVAGSWQGSSLPLCSLGHATPHRASTRSKRPPHFRLLRSGFEPQLDCLELTLRRAKRPPPCHAEVVATGGTRQQEIASS